MQYRNSKEPVKVKVTYLNLKLTVDMDINSEGFKNCFAAKDVKLENGYFKLSARCMDDFDVGK
jgi:hypothetical protein